MSDTNERLSLKGLNFATLELDFRDHVFSITLNRPDRKNAINGAMVNELIYALDYAKQERAIRVVVLAARGDVFCAGGDLREMKGGEQTGAASNVPKSGESDDIVRRLWALDKPSIAKIQGPVYAGGLLLVCSVTHALAVRDTIFAAPEIKRGIWPFQVMAPLFRLVPRREGLDFIMRGEPRSTDWAARVGLINEAVPAADLDARVADLARHLASLATGTMQMGLRALREQEDLSLDDALSYLKAQLDDCLKSEDAREGIAAFMEKRPPKWR